MNAEELARKIRNFIHNGNLDALSTHQDGKMTNMLLAEKIGAKLAHALLTDKNLQALILEAIGDERLEELGLVKQKEICKPENCDALKLAKEIWAEEERAQHEAEVQLIEEEEYRQQMNELAEREQKYLDGGERE